MSPSPAPRRRRPWRLVAILALLALLLPFAPVDWNGMLSYFRGGSDSGEGGSNSSGGGGGGISGALLAPPGISIETAREQLAERAAEWLRRIEDEGGEDLRTLTEQISRDLENRDLGRAESALRHAHEGWGAKTDGPLSEALRGLDELVAGSVARTVSELDQRAREANDRGESDEVREVAVELARVGAQDALSKALAWWSAVPVGDPVSAEDRSLEQAAAWRRFLRGRGSPSSVTDGLRDDFLEQVGRSSAAEAPDALRFADAFPRSAWATRRVVSDLDDVGVELPWGTGDDADSSYATFRKLGGALELAFDGGTEWSSVRVLEPEQLVRLARGLFESLGLSSEEARRGLATLLASHGEALSARTVLLAAPPLEEDEEFERFLEALAS